MRGSVGFFVGGWTIMRKRGVERLTSRFYCALLWLRFEGVMMANFGRLGIFKMQKHSI